MASQVTVPAGVADAANTYTIKVENVRQSYAERFHHFGQQLQGAGAVAAVVILAVLVIFLIIFLWFIYDARKGVVDNLKWWIPIILFLTLLISPHIFLAAAIALIIFTLWFYVSEQRTNDNRFLKYGCDWEAKLRECRKDFCDLETSRSKEYSSSWW